ncbi:MAG: hypothetical protein U0L42_09325 [Methanobrevibacter sp.]|uniref:hypothetical protein n=1 Tax=Methanobrevibacter sp. TaxID=66852 RepID=UPI002E763472|nr:hypothetical protein [Methanobrevibacter sp.]MEE0935861.1 hypothetical protein [Methanobrevibacter sp.]
MIFLVPLMIFSLYLLVFNPGILTVESFAQLHQIATGKFSNNYPVFHSVIEMICLKIYGSPLIMGILQILVFSTMWTLICKYHRDDTSANSDNFVLQAILTIIISIIPVNAVNSITLSNYVLFSYFLMFLCFLIKVMMDNDGEIDNKFLVVLAVTMALVAGFSNYGGYVALISLISIIAYLFKKNKNQDTFIRLAGLTIVLILLITVASFAIAGDDATDVHSKNDKIDLEGAKSQFFSSINDTPKAGFEDVSAANLGNGNYNLLDSFVNAFKDNKLLNLIFVNPIISLMLTILIVFLQSINKSDDMYLVYIPALANTIIVFLTSTAQSNLSQYSNQLTLYVMIVILISMWINDNNILSIPQTLQKREYTQDNYSTSNGNNYIEGQNSPIDLESEIDQLTSDDIDEILREISLEEEIMEPPEAEPPFEENEEEFSSDLIDEILKELEK